MDIEKIYKTLMKIVSEKYEVELETQLIKKGVKTNE